MGCGCVSYSEEFWDVPLIRRIFTLESLILDFSIKFYIPLQGTVITQTGRWRSCGQPSTASPPGIYQLIIMIFLGYSCDEELR